MHPRSPDSRIRAIRAAEMCPKQEIDPPCRKSGVGCNSTTESGALATVHGCSIVRPGKRVQHVVAHTAPPSRPCPDHAAPRLPASAAWRTTLGSTRRPPSARRRPRPRPARRGRARRSGVRHQHRDPRRRDPRRRLAAAAPRSGARPARCLAAGDGGGARRRSWRSAPTRSSPWSTRWAPPLFLGASIAAFSGLAVTRRSAAVITCMAAWTLEAVVAGTPRVVKASGRERRATREGWTGDAEPEPPPHRRTRRRRRARPRHRRPARDDLRRPVRLGRPDLPARPR